ncbi:MAG: ubiquinol-cytochrome c reductase iron-sulfur subunit [Desulfuromonadales bacterium]|nr:ubiquinol-cytochrome c reductase iron-sulfur subunit [Desulfuromonadales bacterium]
MTSEPSLTSRRKMLATSVGVIGAALAALTVWPFWRFLNPQAGSAQAQTVTIDRSQIEVGAAHFFEFRGHAAVLVQPAPGQFAAFSAVCTHLGCIVTWRAQEQIFFCPCHAGRFSPDGRVVGGPPPRPLPSYPVTVTGDQIRIG